ncbi:transmembrane protein 131-like isoform X2 [Amphiura filiformis]|uniref:transmembrane protein 131-like isoform X2 n=1 Tax=Amphiura filiformis TaxID=82378 RepID=UPI003B21F3F3
MSPYQVFGVGVPNPYRLRPFLGAKVPINTSYSPLINMHNPYSSGLMVTEIYSSGGDLHLELPTGSLEAPQNLWVIPPYQTRSVMRASFTGRVESNHTAFIRIKTNHSSSPEEEDEFLMLPVEVEVSSAPGIYASLELLDFGTLRSLDEPKTLPLYLLNTNTQKTIHVTGVSLMRANPAITIDFKPIGVRFVDQHTKVADVTFNPLRANTSRLWSGKIIIKTKDKAHKLQIPYQAHVLQGTLSYDKNSTLFYLPTNIPREIQIKPLALTNFFNFSLVVQQISFPEEVRSIFRLSNFGDPFEIQPQKSDSSVNIVFSPNETMTTLSTDLLLTTNASVFTVPVHAYTGRLKFSAHGGENKQIDFGTMSTKDVRSIFFAVLNQNPIEVPIANYECNLMDCTIEALSIEEGNTTYHLSDTAKPILQENPLVIPANYMAVMRVEVQAPDQEGQFLGEVKLNTEYEQLSIPAQLRTVEGCLSIKPDHVIMKPTFPGYPQSQNMAVMNNFGYRMKLESLLPDPPDDRFFHKPPRKQPDVEVEPHKKQKIGRIVFDPRKYCDTDCYVGLPPADEQVWLQSLALPEETQDVDRLFYNYLRNKWMKLEETGENLINVTMKLNSNLVKGLEIPISAELVWPRLVRNDIINFPLTYIGNSSKGEVTLYNPSDSLILVQLLPIAAYQDPNTVLDLLADRFDSELIEIDDPDTFFMIDVTDKNPECMRPPTSLGKPEPNSGKSTGHTQPPPTPPDTEQQQQPIKININGMEMTVIPIASTEGPAGQQIIIDTSKMDGKTGAPTIVMSPPPNAKAPPQKTTTKTTKKKKEHSPGKCLSTQTAIEENFGVKPNRTALTIGIRPRQNVTISIGFRPNDNRERISLILIRNNLTVLDAFMVRGHGARGELRMNGKKPSARSSLPFELKESHLVDCDRSSPKARVPPNFTVKRTLSLKNTGQLPLAIHKFQINGCDCEGFGFRVLQCRPIELQPNETKRLDIAFTPDFTLSRITRQLSIHTYNSETLEYTLIATLPPHMLSICTSALPRPPWEQLLYAVSAVLMTVLFMGILTAAYLEAVRLMEPVVNRVCEENGEINKLKRFDLRNIPVFNSGDGGGGGGSLKSGSQSVLSSLSGKLPFRQSSSPQRSHESVGNNHDTRAERRPPPNKERVRVTNYTPNSTPYSHSKHGNDFTHSSSTPTIANHDLSHRKVARNRRRASSDVEASWNHTGNRDSSKETPFIKNSDLDPIGDPPDNISRTPSIEELDPAARIKLPKGKRKSKALNSSSRREEREARRAQSKMARKSEETREPDRDDSSSTTTECSNADSEQSDKTNKFEHVVSNGEPIWSSGGPKANAKVSDPEAGVLDLDALKFEDVKPKSKSRKNAKNDNKNTPFNGDVLRPSTLELPYTIPSDKNHRNSKEPTSPHSIAAKAAAKATQKALRAAVKAEAGPKNQVEADAVSTSSSEHDKDSGSPPPLWDQPKPIPTNHVRQLNVQPKLAESGPGAVGTKAGSQFAPGGGLRPNSYSSAVAGSKNDTPKRGKQKSKLGKTYSAPERLSHSAFIPVGDQHKAKHPGAIGTTAKGIFGSKSKSLPRTSNPWSQALNDIDSASDTSSTTSTGPSSPGIFGLGSGKGDAKTGQLDDFYVGSSMWDNKSLGLSDMTPSSSRPKSKHGGLADLFGGLGVSTAPPTSSIWETTPSHVSKPLISSSPNGWSTGMDKEDSQQPLYRSSNPWENTSANANTSADNGWNTSSELFPSSIWSSSSDNSNLLDSNQENQSRGFDPFPFGSTSIWSPASSLDTSRSPGNSPGSRDNKL